MDVAGESEVAPRVVQISDELSLTHSELVQSEPETVNLSPSVYEQNGTGVVSSVASVWEGCSGEESLLVKRCVMSVCPEEEMQVVDLNKLQYYTVAEDVLVETIDLPAAADLPSELQDSPEEQSFATSGDGESPRPEVTQRRRIGCRSLGSEWADVDKLQLLKALKQHGSSDLQSLATMLPDKSPHAIQEAVGYYRSLAASSMSLTAKQIGRRAGSGACAERRAPGSSPLDAWRAALAEAHSAPALRSGTSAALRLLACAEPTPRPDLTCNVDFAGLYELLASTMDGRPPPQLSTESVGVLRRALVDVSHACKYHEQSGFALHLQRLELLNAGGVAIGGGCAPRPPKSLSARAHLDRLLQQRSCNPLRVPETLCKLAPRRL